MIKVFSGSNSYLLNLELNKYLTDFKVKYGDLAIEKVNAGDVSYNNLIETVQAMPFLVEKRLVIVENPSANKECAEKINYLIENINDQTEVIFKESKFDKRSSLYKTLKKLRDFKEFNDLDEYTLSKWITDEVKEQNGSISSADAKYLVQRIGLNQFKLKNELSKLLCYSEKINKQTIDLLTERSPQSTIFELLDAVFNGNKKKAIEIYKEQRKLKEEPQKILGLLNWQLHIFAIIKAAGDKQSSSIASDAKLNPYVVSKSANLVRNLSLNEIKKLVNKSLELDKASKTKSIDIDDAVQNFLITI